MEHFPTSYGTPEVPKDPLIITQGPIIETISKILSESDAVKRICEDIGMKPTDIAYELHEISQVTEQYEIRAYKKAGASQKKLLQFSGTFNRLGFPGEYTYFFWINAMNEPQQRHEINIDSRQGHELRIAIESMKNPEQAVTTITLEEIKELAARVGTVTYDTERALYNFQMGLRQYCPFIHEAITRFQSQGNSLLKICIQKDGVISLEFDKIKKPIVLDKENSYMLPPAIRQKIPSLQHGNRFIQEIFTAASLTKDEKENIINSLNLMMHHDLDVKAYFMNPTTKTLEVELVRTLKKQHYIIPLFQDRGYKFQNTTRNEWQSLRKS